MGRGIVAAVTAAMLAWSPAALAEPIGEEGQCVESAYRTLDQAQQGEPCGGEAEKWAQEQAQVAMSVEAAQAAAIQTKPPATGDAPPEPMPAPQPEMDFVPPEETDGTDQAAEPEAPPPSAGQQRGGPPPSAVPSQEVRNLATRLRQRFEGKGGPLEGLTVTDETYQAAAAILLSNSRDGYALLQAVWFPLLQALIRGPGGGEPASDYHPVATVEGKPYPIAQKNYSLSQLLEMRYALSVICRDLGLKFFPWELAAEQKLFNEALEKANLWTGASFPILTQQEKP